MAANPVAAANLNPGAALPAAINAPARAQRAAPVFALTPALLNTGFLDWTKPENVKLYTKAIEKLGFKFKGKPDQVILVLVQATQNRAELYGLDRTVINIPDADGTMRNLIT